MSSYNALRVYVELLREFQNRLSGENLDNVVMLESGFGYLSQRLSIRNLSLFLWDQGAMKLTLKYAYQEGILMEGEEELGVGPHSPLEILVHDRKPLVVSEKNPWMAYLPLWNAEEKFVGAIRIERKLIFPRGRVLKTLPRFNSQRPKRGSDFPLLEDIADILSGKLQGLNREIRHQKREQYLLAGSEVAAAVVETPRLKEMLEAVSRSIIKNLGFDRIRFFLLDSGHSELRGVLGLQIPDKLNHLEGETYPLKPHVNSLVDCILTKKNKKEMVSAGGKVVYVPLSVGGQTVGCLAVDNLLSQIRIDEEQMRTLRSLASQIGMAVLNARLFEDIEQQAITDGLTKLYVYRYFQQRLKEEIDRADRYSYSVALIMIDVDNFKNFNDTYGHSVGDKVLEFLAQSIRANIRRIDLAARYGGDEFILLLPEITEKEAWLMGTRLLNALKDSYITTNEGEHIKIRITLGVAMYSTDAKSGRDLMEAADKALYWAKRNNRGDICFFRNLSEKVEKT